MSLKVFFYIGRPASAQNCIFPPDL